MNKLEKGKVECYFTSQDKHHKFSLADKSMSIKLSLTLAGQPSNAFHTTYIYIHVSFTSVVYAISKNIPYSAQFFHIDAMPTPCLQLCPVGRTPLSFSPPTTLTLYLNLSHPS